MDVPILNNRLCRFDFCFRIVVLVAVWLPVHACWESANTLRAQDDSAEESQPTVETLLSRLGSPKFRVRDRAAVELYRRGNEVIDDLNSHLNVVRDMETRSRIESILQKLNEKNLSVRISQFLAGEPTDLEGWDWASKSLGDNGSTRSLYARLLRTYPAAVKQWDESSRARTAAVQSVVKAIEAKSANINSLLAVPKDPSVDLFALLIPLADRDVPTSEELDYLVLSLCRGTDARIWINRTPIGPGLRGMLTSWMVRSEPKFRDQVINAALILSLPVAQNLARDVLDKADQRQPKFQSSGFVGVTDPSPSMIAAALRAMARFGSKDDADVIASLVSREETIQSFRTIDSPDVMEVRVGDIAAVTLALIYDADPVDIGLDVDPRDETYGFFYERIGFSDKEEEKRKQLRQAALDLHKKQ